MSHDSQLRQAVLSELAWEPSVSAAHIGVTARGGVICLTGRVESCVEKHAAEMAAVRVKGVEAVVQKIEVRVPFDTTRNDDEMAAAAMERLSWDASAPRGAVMVNVEKGWFILTGQLDWRHQRETAEQDVRPLFGVSNQTTIMQKVNVLSLCDDITHALHRSAFFYPKSVAVSAQGGKVRLTGTVHSWNDWQVAASTAWAAPGATAVQNYISVL